MAEPAPPPRKRALPFKRTVARKQSSDADADAQRAGDDTDLDLFRHSKEVFPEILREVEEESQSQQDHKRRRLSSETKNPSQASRKRSSPSSDQPASAHRQPSTLEGSDDDLIMDVKGKGKAVVRPHRRTVSRTPASGSSAYGNPTCSPANTGAVVTDGNEASDDNSDVVLLTSSPAQPRHSGRPVPPPPPPPNQRRRNVGDNDSDYDGDKDDSSSVEILSQAGRDAGSAEKEEAGAAADEFSEWVARAREMQARTQQAVVKVFVTSRLPGATRPVLARRRLGQGVQLLLDAWVATQDLPDDVAARLFLTWKGNKIYGQSTLASLGVQVDEDGNLLVGPGGEGYLRGGLHLEVWTDEAYAEYLESRDREKARQLAALDEDEDEDEDDDDDDVFAAAGSEGEEVVVPPPAPAQPKRKGVKVVLKSKNYEPLKLKAKDDTTVETVIEVFRVQRNVGPEWDVAIYFDGERLDEDSLVTDADVDPDEPNQFEVHVKERGR